MKLINSEMQMCNFFPKKLMLAVFSYLMFLLAGTALVSDLNNNY